MVIQIGWNIPQTHRRRRVSNKSVSNTLNKSYLMYIIYCTVFVSCIIKLIKPFFHRSTITLNIKGLSICYTRGRPICFKIKIFPTSNFADYIVCTNPAKFPAYVSRLRHTTFKRTFSSISPINHNLVRLAAESRKGPFCESLQYCYYFMFNLPAYQTQENSLWMTRNCFTCKQSYVTSKENC